MALSLLFLQRRPASTGRTGEHSSRAGDAWAGATSRQKAGAAQASAPASVSHADPTLTAAPQTEGGTHRGKDTRDARGCGLCHPHPCQAWAEGMCSALDVLGQETAL